MSFKQRPEFNRMIADAVDGKIDLILLKSLSRFARNTIDSLNTIRSSVNMAFRFISQKGT